MSTRIELSGAFVADTAMVADLQCSAIVALLDSHEFEATATLLVVVPVIECGRLLISLIFGGKRFAGLMRSIFHNYEQSFRVWVVG